MCVTCWKEHGGHHHTSPEIEKAIVLIHRIWNDNDVSMPLHTAIDDWNIESVWEPWPDHKPPVISQNCWDTAVELSALMNSLPVEDRCAAMARADYYIMKEVEKIQ